MSHIVRLLTRRKTVVLLFLAIITLTGGIFFWRQSASEKKSATYIVQRQNLSETLTLSGQIAAEEDITLRFQTAGHLAWVGVKEGDFVKKFQTLASLDQQSVRKNLEKELANYLKVRNNFEGTKETYQNAVITDAIKRILENSQADLNSAVLNVELVDLTRKFSNLWTPIEGIVVFVGTPVAGVNVTPQQAEFRVVNPKTLYFAATADQADVSLLSTSKSGIITLDAFPGQQFTSKINHIAFRPKPGETGTVYEIKMTLPPEIMAQGGRLGMTGDAEFVIKEARNVLAIPEKFLKNDDNGAKYVWLKDGTQKRKQIIKAGETFGDQVEIVSGLTEGDIITE